MSVGVNIQQGIFQEGDREGACLPPSPLRIRVTMVDTDFELVGDGDTVTSYIVTHLTTHRSTVSGNIMY